MTVYEALNQAAALLPGSGGGEAAEEYAVRWANLALAECFDTENSVRLAAGEPELLKIPSVEELRDEIPYCEAIARRAFPCYFASLMAKEEEDGFWASEYRARFVIALLEAARLVPERAADVYGGGARCRN